MSLLRIKYPLPFPKQAISMTNATLTSQNVCPKCRAKLLKLTKPPASYIKTWLGTTTWFMEKHHGSSLPRLCLSRSFSSIPNWSFDEDNFDLELERELFDEEFEGHEEDANKFDQDRASSTLADKSSTPSSSPLKKQGGFLLNYVQSCVNSGFIEQAVKSVMKRQELSDRDMKTLEYLFQTLLNLPGTIGDEHYDVTHTIQLLFRKALQTNLKLSPSACACILAAVKKYDPDPQLFAIMADKIEELYSLQECLDACHKDGETFKHLTAAIRAHKPNYKFQTSEIKTPTPPIVLGDFYEQSPLNTSIRLPGSVSEEDLMKSFDEQLNMEMKGTVKIPNVLLSKNPISKAQKRQREKLNKMHERWRQTASKAFKSVKELERKRWLDGRGNELGVYPFLCLLPDEMYIEIIINHLHKMPSSGELSRDVVFELGSSVFSRYVLKQYLTPESKRRLKNLYLNYSRVYTGREEGVMLRELWEKLEYEDGKMLLENHVAPWQDSWKMLVGNKLLEVMVSSLTVDVGEENTKVPSTYFKNIPAVFNSYKPWGKKIYGMTIPHPVYAQLVASAKGDFSFPAEHVPMIVPPLPWLHPHQGGFLCCPTDFVRRKEFSDLTINDEFSTATDETFATSDALNVLGSVAWKINQPVLDLQLEMFRAKGDKKLKIAPPPEEIPSHLKYVKDLPLEERKKIGAEYFRTKKLKNEMNSLHADALYKFSIANFYRDKFIWLPHNLDFRGRTYPTPPHFNYMGDDVSRSIFMFADGRPLGERGLEWLKIHLANLTGVKKYGSLKDRLDYADQMMDEILDSADRPLEGRCWWKESEEPWQTLAACIELASAVRSPVPALYVSHLPIYQDGSCNGLQHYAALGRDAFGAKQVNLLPSDVPMDVYTGVAEIVEEIREEDAANGVEIARELNGFITRKVVKQTVMTTVYGVTRYGGALQIKKQLVNIDNFPPEKCAKASGYLVSAIFRSISSIFNSSTHIQKWLTDIATCMARGGKSVEWKTTLGLLAVQPYFKTKRLKVDSKVQQFAFLSSTLVPNVVKQCNAFPPNFVHSLDSTHMMLTALHCFQRGIVFSAVHDCYWTHAATVDVMNVLCREQFIALHGEPILESLAGHLTGFLPGEDQPDSDAFIAPAQRETLRQLLNNIPKKGEFDLNQVKNSTFFFS